MKSSVSGKQLKCKSCGGSTFVAHRNDDGTTRFSCSAPSCDFESNKYISVTKKAENTLFKTPAPSALLSDAIEYNKNGMDVGTYCPACSQRVKKDRRAVHAEAVIFLIELVKKYLVQPRFYHIKDILHVKGKNSTDAAYFHHWGLIEKGSAPGNKTAKKSGMYRPTQLGIDFVKGLVTVPAYAMIFNNTVFEWADEQIDVKTALGTKFDYAKL